MLIYMYGWTNDMIQSPDQRESPLLISPLLKVKKGSNVQIKEWKTI